MRLVRIGLFVPVAAARRIALEQRRLLLIIDPPLQFGLHGGIGGDAEPVAQRALFAFAGSQAAALGGLARAGGASGADLETVADLLAAALEA